MVINISDPLFVSIIIAIIGAITGIASLAWHVHNSRTKITLERVEFTKRKRSDDKGVYLGEYIDTSLYLRNKGNRSTSIESIFVTVGNIHCPVEDHFFDIDSNSSRVITFTTKFEAKEFREILKLKKITLGVIILHTFGKIKRFGETDFSSEYYTLY